MDDCIFCKLAQGAIPTDMVYQNEQAAAFKDAHPLAPVHVLVVPKTHHENILDGVDGQLLAGMLDCVEHVVDTCGVRESGFRIVANTGDDAGQTVHHLHWHILGGHRLSDTLA
ncbi:HIT domain-containing protein [Atopobium deltae]|uniref:Histidine triad domain protein n=1 Tax=Atopobium deltae TaxID=1393034 RepID=A0A133XV33_9ACTN|nr:HIT domain-containing protein [Atopobium deltae]KXB34814.1 histidine triad domain protein [Atopobium deltae]